ncbi:hypothetical protein R1sor_011511 [Riccia sorocarpa]|uniref:Uncharacterized protein n=1 Tax=Riccia sorocarpa TaxID=122646 RepID=A0ABD3I4R5_9MARC
MNLDRDNQKKSPKPPETSAEKDKRPQAGMSDSTVREETGLNQYGGKTILKTRHTIAGSSKVVHSYEKIYKDRDGITVKQETYDSNWKIISTWSQTGWTDAMRLCIGSEHNATRIQFLL